MLTKSIYLQKCHCSFVNIGFHKTDVKVAMLKAFFLVVRRNISKLEKFLQKEKIFILIDYSLIVIDYTRCLKLAELCLVSVQSITYFS